MKPFWRARVRGAQLRILSPQRPLSKEILLIKHVSLRQLQKRFGQVNKRGRAEPSCLAESASQPASHVQPQRQPVSQPASSQQNKCSSRASSQPVSKISRAMNEPACSDETVAKLQLNFNCNLIQFLKGGIW